MIKLGVDTVDAIDARMKEIHALYSSMIDYVDASPCTSDQLKIMRAFDKEAETLIMKKQYLLASRYKQGKKEKKRESKDIERLLALKQFIAFNRSDVERLFEMKTNTAAAIIRVFEQKGLVERLPDRFRGQYRYRVCANILN